MMPETKKNEGRHKKQESVPLDFDFAGEHYSGLATPVKSTCSEEACFELDVSLNAEHLGTIYCGRDMKWTLKGLADQELVNRIGQIIALWYE